MSLSKGQKSALSVLGVILIGVIIAGAFVYTLTNMWERNKNQANERCANIARLAGDKEFMLGDGWECYILNGNKIERID